MIKRCMMLFPEFKNSQIIDDIRNRYDPLASHVKPHITLVFPFDSDISASALKKHINSVVSGVTPFEIVLQGITAADDFGRYLFLNIQKGTQEIFRLHHRLYTSILEQYYPDWLKGKTFLPHMTVGCFDNDEDYIAAIEDTKNMTDVFSTMINALDVEIIDKNEDSQIELTSPFNSDPH